MTATPKETTTITTTTITLMGCDTIWNNLVKVLLRAFTNFQIISLLHKLTKFHQYLVVFIKVCQTWPVSSLFMYLIYLPTYIPIYWAWHRSAQACFHLTSTRELHFSKLNSNFNIDCHHPIKTQPIIAWLTRSLRLDTAFTGNPPAPQQAV